MGNLTRRHFATRMAAGLAGASLLKAEPLPAAAPGTRVPEALQAAAQTRSFKTPVTIASSNGFTYGCTAEAYAKLAAGADTLEAVLSGVNKVEENPADMSVGYGALPNEDGVVTNDACCIHGPTMQMGAVGCLAGFLHTSRVAQAILENTDHIMMVGPDAARFAETMGCAKAPPGLTEKARQRWVLWKETRSLRDSWGPGIDSPRYDDWQKYKATGSAPADAIPAIEKLARQIGIPQDEIGEAIAQVFNAPHGTINCLGVNSSREISGVTTTAGMAWKIPGRCGDSPILGAGCYVDGEVGGAGSTGRGEENIRVAGAHTVVEMMRNGRTPEEGCLEALRRIAHLFQKYPDRLARVEIQFYALRVDGAYGAASLWGAPGRGGGAFAVNDGTNRTEPMAFLLPRPPAPAGL